MLGGLPRAHDAPHGHSQGAENQVEMEPRFLLALDSQDKHQGDGLLQGAFLMHVASSCPLAANSSVMDFNFTEAFNKNHLVCYDSDTQCFITCSWRLLWLHATHLAAQLNNDSTWVQRTEARHQACSDLALRYWGWTALRSSEPLGGLGMRPWCGGIAGEYCLGCYAGWLQSMLPGGVAQGHCTEVLQSLLHGVVAWGHCTAFLQSMLHGIVAQRCCMGGVLHRGVVEHVARRCCTGNCMGLL